MGKKKSFLEDLDTGIAEDNPALQFISKREPEEPEPQPQAAASSDRTPPEGYKLNPMFIETKTRRVQIVLQPSLYERVKAAAKAKGVSVNEYIHNVLDVATREE